MAHLMDPARRELYVEGQKDRMFLQWLLGGGVNQDASVREIASVDMPDVQLGGERGRLLRFAELLVDHDVRIMCFADADCDRVLGRVVPSRVWLTDQRDIEGYVLRLECVDKVLRLGVGTERIAAADLMRWLTQHGRRLGIIRLMSELDGLRLPFQATKKEGHFHFAQGQLRVDYQGYVTALLQNANMSLTGLAPMMERLSEIEIAYSSTPDRELVHGKDAMCLFEVVMRAHGLRPSEGTRLLWTSYESSLVEPGSSLESALAFLTAS